MKDVTIYSTPNCHYCNLAKEFFKDHNVQYTAYDVSVDREKLTEMIDMTGSRAVPVIKVGDDVVVGFEPRHVAQMLGIAI